MLCEKPEYMRNRVPIEAITGISAKPQPWLFRKIWLPKICYDLIPLVYLCNGLGALWATLYVIDWYWYLPFCVLLAFASFHMAFWVYSLRRRGKQQAARTIGAIPNKTAGHCKNALGRSGLPEPQSPLSPYRESRRQI